MPTVNLNYLNPTSALVAAAQETLSLEVGRNPKDGTEAAFLVLTRGGSTSEAIKTDISEAYKTCIYGNGLTARPGRYMTRLTAAEVGLSPGNTTLSLENSGAPTDALPRGLNAAVDQPIAIVDYFKTDGTPNTVEYRMIATVPDGTSITINESLDNSYVAGAMVFNLAYGSLPLYGTGRGSNKKDGAKSYYENPVQPSISLAWQVTPQGVLVSITASSSNIIRERYQVYVRSSLDDVAIIEPHWVADATITSITTPTLVTTYDGGTAAGGGAQVGGTEYQILVAAEDYRGGQGVPSLAKGSPARQLSFIAI